MAQISGTPPLNGERVELGEARPVLNAARSIERAEDGWRLPALQGTPCPALKSREVREHGRFVCFQRMEASHG